MNKFNDSALSGQHLKVFTTLHEIGTVTANDYQQDLILPKVYNAVSPLVKSLYLEIYPYSKGSEKKTLSYYAREKSN